MSARDRSRRIHGAFARCDLTGWHDGTAFTGKVPLLQPVVATSEFYPGDGVEFILRARSMPELQRLIADTRRQYEGI